LNGTAEQDDYGQPEPELTRNAAECPTPWLQQESLNLVNPVLPSCSGLLPVTASWHADVALLKGGLTVLTFSAVISQLSGLQGATSL
jgi:hypothetical protein